MAKGINTFENDVNMYGTQAYCKLLSVIRPFENDVNMYGTQARNVSCLGIARFENDVNMYGTQAKTFPLCSQEKFENDVNLIILRYTEEVLSHFGTKPLFCYMTVKRRE